MPAVIGKYGISHRIVHSHATVYAESKGKAVRNRMLWSISQKYITDRIGCSQASRSVPFGKKRLYCVKKMRSAVMNMPITKQQEMKSEHSIRQKISLLLEMMVGSVSRKTRCIW